ncbi:putative uracil DNA glycosylase UNG [Betaentomopoxvirus amoorei]|uniref:Uracil-DNA glycosylase n=1 Tax=Amsacta moorei entomopoxvirus TaxID=28321 RepID=Q9EMH5_AMEPV|nr:putative uracil DNA glycosylase UNG [Amsacta moorei entomopoxvirus]AAG02937.1 AMV231 [Amsacta moorei entomopoxvirus]
MNNISYKNFIENIPEKWLDVIDKKQLEYAHHKLKNESIIKPSINNIFKCFKYFNPDQVKVIILGQDPYPTVGMADGLAFSCSNNSNYIPKSLQNIIKEILKQNKKYDMMKNINMNYINVNLEFLAKQQILLFNTILTVGDEPMSHKHIWESFSNSIIKKLSLINNNIVFILFGAKAHNKIYFIENKKNHCIIKTSHPSNLSCYKDGYDKYVPFNNSDCFNICNEYLIKNNIKPIDWLSELIKNN